MSHKRWINTAKSAAANNSLHAAHAVEIKAMGFEGAMSDVVTADFLPSTYGTATYRTTNVDAILSAYAASGLKFLAVVYPAIPTSASWNTQQTTTNASGSLAFNNGKRVCTRHAATVAQVATYVAYFVSYIQTKWVSSGGHIEDLYIQFAREPGSGGAGGVNSGDAAYSDFANVYSDGVWDRNTDWDAVATDSGNAVYNDVTGFHEIMNAILPLCSFQSGIGGVVAPSFEHQTAATWRALGSTLVGANTVAAMERTTCAISGFTTWWNYMTHKALNIYVGDYSGYKEIGVDYAKDMIGMAVASATQLDSVTTYAVNAKPLILTEVGFNWKWIKYGGKTNDQTHRGYMWRMICDALPTFPCVFAGMYRFINYDASGDSAAGADCFGIVTSTGNMSAGAASIYQTYGTNPTPSGTDPLGGTWQTGSNSS